MIRAAARSCGRPCASSSPTGITLLLTTQYLEEADALADRIVLIDHGREIAKGTPSELKALVGDQRVDVVAVDSQGFEQLKQELSWQGLELTLQPEQRRISIPAPDEVTDLNRVATAVAATRIPIDEIALRRPTLDDAFISLTGHAAEEAADRRGGGGMTAFARESLLLTFRSLRAIPRVPERILDVTIQPIVFILLFRYVFGSAIHVPGVAQLLELPDARADRPGPRLRDDRRRRGDQPRHGRGCARPLPLDAGEPPLDRHRSGARPVRRGRARPRGLHGDGAGLCGWRPSFGAGDALEWVGLMLLGTFAFTWAGAYFGMLVRSPDAMQGVGFIIVFPLASWPARSCRSRAWTLIPRAIGEWDPISALVATSRKLADGYQAHRLVAAHARASWRW